MKQSTITSAIIPGTVSNYNKQKETEVKQKFNSLHWKALTVGAWERSTARAAVFSASKLLYLLHWVSKAMCIRGCHLFFHLEDHNFTSPLHIKHVFLPQGASEQSRSSIRIMLQAGCNITPCMGLALLSLSAMIPSTPTMSTDWLPENLTPPSTRGILPSNLALKPSCRAKIKWFKWNFS